MITDRYAKMSEYELNIIRSKKVLECGRLMRSTAQWFAQRELEVLRSQIALIDTYIAMHRDQLPLPLDLE